MSAVMNKLFYNGCILYCKNKHKNVSFLVPYTYAENGKHLYFFTNLDSFQI